MHGLSYILKRTAPSLCLGDVQNIETDVSLTELAEGEWKSALYLYDTIEGGVGYAEKIFEIFDQALKLCKTIIDECPCVAGCPSCVTSLPPGVDDAELEQLCVESNASVECTRSLLTALLTGEIAPPEVSFHELPVAVEVVPPEPDAEPQRLKQRLGKAAKILQDKRARVH